MSNIDPVIEEEPGKIRIVYPLVINLNKPSKNYRILVKRGDDKSRAIKFTLVNNGVKYNLDGNDVASLRAIREDGAITFADCEIKEDGTCEYTFTENMTSAAGLVTAELSIVTGVGETISTFEFYIIVEKILYNENDYVSESDLSGFKEYLAKARAAAEAAEEAQEYCEEAVEISTDALQKAADVLERTETAIIKADEAVERAEEAAQTIEGAEAEVLENMEIVRGFKNEAESARDLAEDYKDAAEASKDAAQTSEGNAKASEEYVAGAVPIVLQAVDDAQTARNIAIQKAQDATDAKDAAEDAQALAEAAQKAAEDARDEAKAIVGVDIASTTQAGIVKIGEHLQIDRSDGKLDVKVENAINTSNDPISSAAVKAMSDAFDSALGQITGAVKANAEAIKDNADAIAENKEAIDDLIDNKADKTDLDNKANKYTAENRTLYANSWVGDAAPYTYDLGYADDFDIEILLANTADAAVVEAVVNAQISGNGGDNIIRAWGDKPSVEIPIIVRKVEK